MQPAHLTLTSRHRFRIRVCVAAGLALTSLCGTAAESVPGSGSASEQDAVTACALGSDSSNHLGLSTEEKRDRLATLQLLGVDLNVRTLSVYHEFGLIGSSRVDACGTEQRI